MLVGDGYGVGEKQGGGVGGREGYRGGRELVGGGGYEGAICDGDGEGAAFPVAEMARGKSIPVVAVGGHCVMVASMRGVGGTERTRREEAELGNARQDQTVRVDEEIKQIGTPRVAVHVYRLRVAFGAPRVTFEFGLLQCTRLRRGYCTDSLHY